MNCVIEDCYEEAQVRGACRVHYRKARREGLLLPSSVEYHEPENCSVETCGEPARTWRSGNPLCSKHDAAWAKWGDPEYVSPKMTVVEDTLLVMKEAVANRSREGCWTWEGRLHGGYGAFGKLRAHQVALELNGQARPEPPFDNALHSCDNKWCWNPDHLRWGTVGENARDYAERWGYCPHCNHCNNET